MSYAVRTRARRILEVVESRSPKPTTVEDVFEALKYSRAGIRRMLGELADRGLVEETPEGWVKAGSR